MKSKIRLIIALGIVVMATSACKTKQKVAQIPAGANIEATTPVVVNPTPTENEVSSAPQAVPSYSGAEVTRNENFSLAEGETNSDVLKYKYHVVVGSFTSQTNAKELRSKLNLEGNKALVVLNAGGWFRVLIASFNEYPQARARITQITNRFPDAWVLVRK